jgi:hypothetical protein
MEVTIPPLYEVANAIGAALTRSTAHLVLTADTSIGKVSVPMLEVFRSIPRTYDLESAIAEAKSLLLRDLEKAGVNISPEEIQITQADSFNIVEDFYTTGKNIRVVAQVQPAVIVQLDPASTDILIDGRS